MRRLVLLASVLCALAGPSMAAAQDESFYRDQAQRQKCFAVKLIRIVEVRRELALTPEQASAIDLILKDHRERYDRMAKSLDTNSNAHGSSIGAVKALDELDRDAEKRIFNSVGPAQRLRLRAIQYQALGFEALYEKDLQKTLAVTKDQSKRIDSFRKAHGEALTKAMRSMSAQFTAEMLADAVNRLQAEGATQILAILDEAQREKYKALLGTPLASVTRLTQFGG